MGFLRKSVGAITVETRRESFVIHSSEPGPHPEFYYYDMPDLIAALLDASGAESTVIEEQRLHPPTGHSDQQEEGK